MIARLAPFMGFLVLLASSCDQPSAPRTAPASSSERHAPSSAPSASSAPARPWLKLSPGGRAAVAGSYGVVTSVEEQATRAGVEILEQGGNAVDAAVAVAYALSVTHPSAASVGGGGFMLLYVAGETHALDFREVAPHSLTQERFDRMIEQGGIGPSSIGVPGFVAGMELAHERFGKLPIDRVMASAIALAEKGYLLGDRQAKSLTWNWASLSKLPEFRKRFAAPNSDDPYVRGARVRRPQLAKTLSGIAIHGAQHFYRGPIARGILARLEESASWSAEDLANYQAKWREPLAFSYRSFDLLTMPPPSAGGVALMQTLLLLEHERAYRAKRESVEALHLFVEAAKRAHAERRLHVVDPDTLSANEKAKRRRRWHDVERIENEHPIRRDRTTPAAELSEHYEALLRETEHTTHFAVVDVAGNAVSCTITLSAAYGSRTMIDELGIILNNAVASFGTVGDNLPAGGRRTLSSMAPTLVFQRDRLQLVLGSPGGDTIPNTIAQVFLNVVDHGLTIDRAAAAPRIHHGFVPDEIRYERARPIAKSTRQALEKLGHRFSKKTIPIGDANVVLVTGDRAFAYADRREGGLALAARAATATPGGKAPAPHP